MSKKLFYRIGEACKLLDIQPYVLRYWETEFPVLQPRKSKAGQRVYSEEELQLIQRIKQLLYEEGYTIAGAKKKLEAELSGGGVPAPVETASGTTVAMGSKAPSGGATTASSSRAPARAASAAAGSAGARAAPASEDEAADAAVATADLDGESLDSAAGEQVERLRTGLQEALAEAREILRLLSA